MSISGIKNKRKVSLFKIKYKIRFHLKLSSQQEQKQKSLQHLNKPSLCFSLALALAGRISAFFFE